MVQINRMAGKTEKQPCVSEWLLRSGVHAVAGRNRCGSERRIDGEGLEGTHNGVRGDVVVEVIQPKAIEQRNHQPDMGGCYDEGRSKKRVECKENVFSCWGHHGASGWDGIHAA